jgi:hypothetical protein
MDSSWLNDLLVGIITINQILTAGIAITAFSLFFYSLSFNLRNRVARSFAFILLCVVIVFTSEALESSSNTPDIITVFLKLEWVGIIFLPAAYLHFSDAILVTTGRPSRGRRRIAVRILYLISFIFLILLASGNLLGSVILDNNPAPHLERTLFAEFFTLYYVGVMVWAWINFARAFRHTLTRSGRRRMIYLIGGATAPAIGSFPFLLYGSTIAQNHAFLFWGIALLNSIVVGGLIIVMAYAVAFFGVSWPDRVIKSRLFKWIMRGPVTASITLGVMTIVRRVGEFFGIPYSSAVPTSMVIVVLLMEHTITLIAPLWERWIFFGNDRTDLILLQKLGDRLITKGDLKQFLEAILAAIRDHLQSGSAFVAAFNQGKISMLISNGLSQMIIEDRLDEALEVINSENRIKGDYYLWNDFWIFPLYQEIDNEEIEDTMIGLVGASITSEPSIQPEQRQSLDLLLQRASQALQDNVLQENIFNTLQDLQPQIDQFQKWRAVGRFDSKSSLLMNELPPEPDFANWVKDALSHYWGGPKLSQSPLLQLQVVKNALGENENPVNALRSIIKQAMVSIKPEGERRFTAEWILYNILELKFMEGWKVRDIATRLAMSEADFYRKQRVAIEEVARVIREMENHSI